MNFFLVLYWEHLTFKFFVSNFFFDILNVKIIEKKNSILMHFYGDYKSWHTKCYSVVL